MESCTHLVCAVLLVLAVGAAPSLAGATYLGCYSDQIEGTLKAYFQELSVLQTPNLCIDVCTRNGFEYAGVTGSKCFCDKKIHHNKKADEKVCSKPCEGDSSEKCGGEWAINIYKTEVKDLKTRYQYNGCYRDKVEQRQLSSYHVDLQDVLTPQVCLDICTLKGSVFAGLQHGSQCYCGDEIKKEDQVDDDECDIKCHGDSSQKCGGNLRNAVLFTNIEATSVATLTDNDYIGCFQDQEKPRLLQGFSLDLPNVLTPHLCVDLCKRKNFEYAGLEDKTQCFCGNGTLPETAKVDESQCSKKCSGASNTICGSPGRATVYRTFREVSAAFVFSVFTLFQILTALLGIVGSSTSPHPFWSSSGAFEEDIKTDVETLSYQQCLTTQSISGISQWSMI